MFLYNAIKDFISENSEKLNEKGVEVIPIEKPFFHNGIQKLYPTFEVGSNENSKRGPNPLRKELESKIDLYENWLQSEKIVSDIQAEKENKDSIFQAQISAVEAEKDQEIENLKTIINKRDDKKNRLSHNVGKAFFAFSFMLVLGIAVVATVLNHNAIELAYPEISNIIVWAFAVIVSFSPFIFVYLKDKDKVKKSIYVIPLDLMVANIAKPSLEYLQEENYYIYWGVYIFILLLYVTQIFLLYNSLLSSFIIPEIRERFKEYFS